jgi:hypothetical protein
MLPSPYSENTYVFVWGNADVAYRTLAHEIGHALTNGPDSANPPYVFYPAWNPTTDTNVNSRRRMPSDTIQQARTLRPVGNLTATGNRMLTTP